MITPTNTEKPPNNFAATERFLKIPGLPVIVDSSAAHHSDITRSDAAFGRAASVRVLLTRRASYGLFNP